MSHWIKPKRGIAPTVVFIYLAAIAAAVTVGSGCGGGTPIGHGNEAQYTFNLVVEKNLDENRDYVYLKFLRDGIGIIGGYVEVGADSIPTNASGQALRTYSPTQFSHGELVRIEAVDPESSFVYRDSILIPGAFYISNLSPQQHLWQPGSGQNPIVEWTGAVNVSRYTLSVTPSLVGSPARGLAQVVDGTFANDRSVTFPPDAFRNPQTEDPVNDLYNIHIIAYRRNVLPRPGSAYRTPVIDNDAPIANKNVSGAIAAAVVAIRDTIRVDFRF